MIFIIFCLYYIWSVYYSRKFMILSYSNGGQWYCLKPDNSSVIVTLIPVTNTLYAVGYFSKSYLRFPPEKPDSLIVKRYFGIK